MIFNRHPRFAIATVVLLVCTLLFLLSPPESLSVTSTSAPSTNFDPSLSTRLKYAEEIYQRVVNDRHGLIKKFGPTADQVVMFPPNEAPWPPYTFWDFFPASFNCPHDVERIGPMGDGGKWMCGVSRLQRKPDCVIYSFGINYESGWEAALMSRVPGCEVWGYDFSVESFGPEIEHVSSLKSRAHFYKYGLSGTDAHGPNDENKMYTMQTLMKMNGHKFIDVLKIDVEGWEFDTLKAFLQPYIESGTPLPFGQLQLEMHVWKKKFPDMLQWWESMEKAGLRPFWTEPNLVYANYNTGGAPELAEYSFINIRGNHDLVADPGPPTTAI